MPELIGYIADDQIHVGPLGEAIEPLVSRFAERYQSRSEEHAAKHAWKHEERQAGLLGARELWGSQGAGGADRTYPVEIARGTGPGKVVYMLQGGPILSILENTWTAKGFEYEAEVRLASHRDRRIAELSPDPAGPRFCCVTQGGTEGGHVAVMDGEGKQLIEVTRGDADDAGPCWHPTRSNCVVYQSSGLARGPEGEWLGQGPAAILQLEVKDGTLETLLEDPALDFLGPRFDGEGNLYCIQRTYRTLDHRPSTLAALTDAALVPMRIGSALFGALEGFVRRNAGRSLGEKSEAEVLRQQAALARRQRLGPAPMPRPRVKDDEDAWRVPEDWKLVKVVDGRPEVVAERVLDFDVLSNGQLVWTDGRSLLRGDPGAEPEVVGDAPRVRRVVALGPVPD